jgi:hypothetical protein
MRVDGGIKGETHTWRRRRCHSFDLAEHVSDRAELGEISLARENRRRRAKRRAPAVTAAPRLQFHESAGFNRRPIAIRETNAPRHLLGRQTLRRGKPHDKARALAAIIHQLNETGDLVTRMRSSTRAATRALFHPAEMRAAEIGASVTKSATAPRFSRASHARLQNQPETQAAATRPARDRRRDRGRRGRRQRQAATGTAAVPRFRARAPPRTARADHRETGAAGRRARMSCPQLRPIRPAVPSARPYPILPLQDATPMSGACARAPCYTSPRGARESYAAHTSSFSRCPLRS